MKEYDGQNKKLKNQKQYMIKRKTEQNQKQYYLFLLILCFASSGQDQTRTKKSGPNQIFQKHVACDSYCREHKSLDFSKYSKNFTVFHRFSN